MPTIVFISHASKVKLKILQARLQQYVNWEFPDVQAGFRKDRGTRDQIASIHWIIEKAREFKKRKDICFIDYTKAFDGADHNKLWKILKEMGIPDHLTCLLRNLYAGQEATVRIRCGTMDWFKIRKGVHQGCLLSPYLSYIQNTSRKKYSWMNSKLESTFPEEISTTPDIQMTPPLWQKVNRNQRASWWGWNRRVKKLA